MNVLDQVQRIIGNRTNVLVIEDSLHKYNMVLENIEMYHRFVPVGGIMLGDPLQPRPTFTLTLSHLYLS